MTRRMKGGDPEPERCTRCDPQTGRRCIRVRDHSGNHTARHPTDVGEYTSWKEEDA